MIESKQSFDRYLVVQMKQMLRLFNIAYVGTVNKLVNQLVNKYGPFYNKALGLLLN